MDSSHLTTKNSIIEASLSPAVSDIDFLTKQIGLEAEGTGIDGQVTSFGFFIRNDERDLIAGCNGCIVFGGIYTDQLWVHSQHRRKGYARQLMNKVHELGRQKMCKIAYLITMSFQDAEEFYHKLGYETDFRRDGYVGQSKMIFLKQNL